MPDRPSFAPDQASRISDRLFGVLGEARELPSERDRNFRIDSDDGTVHVLKIAQAGQSQSTLKCQNAVLQRVEERAPELLVPRVVASREGRRIEPLEGPDGTQYLVRLLSFLPGVPLAEVLPRDRRLIGRLGEFLGKLNAALVEFRHAGAQQDLLWHPDRGLDVIRESMPWVPGATRRALLEGLLESLQSRLAPHIPELRRSVIHSDANDHNVLVRCQPAGDEIAGLIDFGDLLEAATVADAANAAAYAMLDQNDPIAAACWLISGFHRGFPLQEPEIENFFDLARLRLGMSAAIAARQLAVEPDNDYLAISQGAVWRLLEDLAGVDLTRVTQRVRHSCDLPAARHGPRLRQWMGRAKATGRVLDLDDPVGASSPARTLQAGGRRSADRVHVLDLSLTSPDLAVLGRTPTLEDLTGFIARGLEKHGATLGVGRYAEPRLLYASELFKDDLAARTVHLGVDLFAPASTRVLAPCAGRVHSFQVNQGDLDYGPTLLLEHEPEQGLRFYTLYGHLGLDCMKELEVGTPVEAGEAIANLGTPEENGRWPPHLHFQVITDVGASRGDFPGVAAPDEAPFWLDLCPSPHEWLGLPETTVADLGRTHEELLEQRRQHLGPSLSVSYQEPLKIVRGQGQHLFDHLGRRFLDAVNNVPHVGHCHPHVVRAAARQAAVLNTNTRYLHDAIVDYTWRLGELLPDPLRVCFLVCSGSEANELALRLARTHTGRQDMLVLDSAYHGHSSALIDLSPYKHDGPGGSGAPAHVHVLDRPDPYRGRHRGADSAVAYVADARLKIEQMVSAGREPAAVFAEPLLGCGGQIEPPPGYLDGLFQAVREAGGVCVADEVQVGFGRVGDALWAFELQSVVPDIVTLGKPIGNGHPLAAVVTTEEVAESFHNGMEYFNTFGGNPVSCAVGQAVLDVLEGERLQANAQLVGGHLRRGLEELATRHALIGNVRGRGLFLGVELVLDRAQRRPAPEHATAVVERMKEHGVLISTDGPDHNVLKIKPPLVFTIADADCLCRALADVLQQTALLP